MIWTGSGTLASAQPSDAERPVPAESGSLLHDDGGNRWSPPLPAEGARIALRAGDQPAGWLDVWGNGGPADAEARAGLSDVARLVSILQAPRP